MNAFGTLPPPQALIKKFHASHYMKGLHKVVHRDEQAQGVMGLRHRKLRSPLNSVDLLFYNENNPRKHLYNISKICRERRLIAYHIYVLNAD